MVIINNDLHNPIEELRLTNERLEKLAERLEEYSLNLTSPEITTDSMRAAIVEMLSQEGEHYEDMNASEQVEIKQKVVAIIENEIARCEQAAQNLRERIKQV